MEQTPSVILKLMGLDKVPSQHSVRDKQKVLPEKYLQKVASIGVRKKRSSNQHHSFGESTDEKEESEGASKVVKTIRKNMDHNPSKGNGKENPYLFGTKVKGVPQQLLDASYVSVNRKPESLDDTTSSLNLETSVNSGRIAEQQGNLQLQLQQKANNGSQKGVNGHGEVGLYETLRFSKSQLDLKDEIFNSRIAALKANPGNGGNGLKYVSIPSSCKNSHFADGMLQEIFCPRSMKVYPEMRERKNISYHINFGKQSSRSFSDVSDEVYVQTGNAANRVLDTVSTSFFRGNEVLARSSDMLKPASNISVNEIQRNSLVLCSDGSYVGSETKNKSLEQRDVTAKLRAVGQHGQGSPHHQLPTISAYGYRARNMKNQSYLSNDKTKKNFTCKVGVKYGCARKVPMTRPLCAASVIADNRRTMTMDNFFQKYWGLMKNASSNRSTQKSRNKSINQKDCSEDSSEESLPFSTSFNSNHIEENCIGLHKLKKKCYGNDLSDKKVMLPQLPRSGPSSTFIDSQILQETCLMIDDVENNKCEDSNMSKQNIVSPNSSVDCLVSDAKIEVVGWSHNTPTHLQSELTASGSLCGDFDSFSHTSHASTQQEASEFQEDSVYSLCSGIEPDSLGSFDEAYGPSPISVLKPWFREDTLSSSESLKVVGTGVCDSSEVDDEGFGLNVSSDEDCGDESVGDFEEKKDLVGIFRAEESRDFSYVVEVLTEAGIANRNLFTDSSTWYSAECPISPAVFEMLEKKFGEQLLWKRSERRFFFDRINLGLLEILQPCSYIPVWEKPVSRRLNAELSQDLIEEEIWRLLVTQEKKASKESADKMLGGEISWVELGDEVEDIVREIVKFLIEEFADEIVSLENF